MRFNLDTYIQKNEEGYFTDEQGGLFVELNNDYLQPIGNSVYKGDNSLIAISRDGFINLLLNTEG